MASKIKQKRIDNFVSFLTDSTSAYSSTQNMLKRLQNAGYKGYTWTDIKNLNPGDKGYISTTDSCVLAFSIGKKNLSKGFRVFVTHSDSPSLRIKPKTSTVKDGITLLNTEVYGGPLLNTWFDRPLGISGRVIIKENKGLVAHLFDSKSPIAILPNLAIHMNRNANEGVAIDKQKVLSPVLSLESDPEAFLNYLAKELQVKCEDILDFDLFTYDAQPPVFTGLNQELISASRLDNLSSSDAASQAFAELGDHPGIAVFFAADNEEIGNTSYQGANSTLLVQLLNNLFTLVNTDEDLFDYLDRSFLVSADVSHAKHPNYSEYADPDHQPKINQGPIIKVSARKSYITDGLSSAFLKDIAQKNNIPIQIFVNHNNHPGGSTTGPDTISHIPIRGIDIGNPIWGMHSIRETCGPLDHSYMIDLIKKVAEYPGFSFKKS